MAIAVVVLTGLVLPVLKSRYDRKIDAAERRAQEAQERTQDQRADKETIADLARGQIDRLFSEYRQLRDDLRQEIRERDVRIDELERKVTELQAELGPYRAGLRAPAGFVVLPLATWQAIRDRLGTELTIGRLPGEDDLPS